MNYRLVPLGTNGFYASFGRHTMSYLLLVDNRAILLDAGTGVARLIEDSVKRLLEPYSQLDIILSHYHVDHVAGLCYLPGVWPGKEVRIYAPGKPFVEFSPEEALSRLLNPPIYPLVLRDLPIEVVPITTQFSQIGDISLEVWPQKHSGGGSVGMRIADQLIYVTDTPVDLTNTEHAKGGRLLLHELWLTDAEAANSEVERSRHSYLSGVAQFCTESNVEQLMFVHHNPVRNTEDLSRIADSLRNMLSIPVILPEETKVYQF